MVLTITRKTTWLISYNSVTTIRIDKKITADITNNETISLDLPAPTASHSINFVHFPSMTVQDGDKVLIKTSRLWLFLHSLLLITFFPLLFLLFTDYFSDLYQIVHLFWFLLLILSSFMPHLQLVKLPQD